MKERPILFSSEMVKAILEGRKTMTRRIMKVQPPNDGEDYQVCRILAGDRRNVGKYRWVNKNCLAARVNAPYFSLPWENGDRLWVRETWYYEEHMHDSTAGGPDLPGDLYSHRLVFKADCPDYPVNVGVGQHGWRPSIFMPRWASRILLEVTDIKVERLQDITEGDAEKEGINEHPYEYADSTYYDERPWIAGLEANISAFAGLWDSINGRKPGKSWNDNPWVWGIEFKVITQ
jgi:hypothetical protein